MNTFPSRSTPASSPALPRLFALLLPFLLLAGTARATLIWQADPTRGTANFENLNIDEPGGTITVAPDPLGQYGNVFKYYLPDETNGFGKERTESKGTVTPSGTYTLQNNTDYYIGWRSMWNPMPVNPGWVALFQVHGYGPTGQPAPLVLRCINSDGTVSFQNGVTGGNQEFWQTPFHTNLWQNFVVHINISADTNVGYVEVWYNGVNQTLPGGVSVNGASRLYCQTLDPTAGSYDAVKWGVYRSGAMDGKGPATAYMSGAKLGTTYADVDPTGGGGGDFSIAGSPSSQIIAPGAGTNYTVTITPSGGFASNVVLSASGLPSGATANFVPPSITGSGSSTMTINTSVSTPPGSSAISILGTSGALAHSNSVQLVVSGFNLSAAPTSATVSAGGGTNFTVTVTTNSSFSGSISFGVIGLPAGAGYQFAPTSLTQSGTTTLTLTTTTNTPGGVFPLKIFGVNGTVIVNTPATLGVTGLQANPGTLLWTDGSSPDTNWSTGLNWTNLSATGNGPPGVSNSVLMTNIATAAASALTAPGSGVVVPANINQFVNANYSVNALTNFANAASSSPNYHNLQIASGSTLTVISNVVVGCSTFYDFGGNNVSTLSVSGAGGTLQTLGSVVVSADSGSSGTHNATLDLSGLDNYIQTGTQLQMGIEGSSPAHAASGVIYLAKTNSITLYNSGYTDSSGLGSPNGGHPALVLGHNSSAFGNGSRLYLGISNAIFMDYATIGRGDTNVLFAFNPAFLSQQPSVYIRGTNGPTSPVGVYVIGDGSAGAQGNNAPSTNDFSGGTVDALINYLGVGRGRSSATSSVGGSGVLTWDTGAISANTLAVGFLYPSGSNSQAIGTVNVNGSATLNVNSNLLLSSSVLTTNNAVTHGQGTLNINGGSVQGTNIIGGGGTSTINLNSGTLELQPGWAATPGVVSNISTLTVGANGSSAPALLADAALISTMNTLTIASNGTIAGNPNITAPSLVINGSLSPGNSSAGAVTNSGSVTLGAGGSYGVTIDDALAGPAVGWTFLQAGGALNVQSTPANPFTIAVNTANNPAANFDWHANYNWVIAAGSSIANFAANDFTIDTSAFVNNTGSGSFYLHTSGNSLVLSFTNNLPPVTNSVALNIAASQGNLTFSGANGNASYPYRVLSSTNLMLPLSNWTVVYSNVFDTNGNFIFTNPTDTSAPRRFYLLRLQ